MNELMDKLDNLKNELDSSTLVNDIKSVLNKVKSDKDLMKLLDEYSKNNNTSLKEKILDNKTFREFKIKETELNLFIMEINSKLKTISKKGSCRHESN